MKDRCYNPNNKDYAVYGGRGITVCDRWRNSFAAFLEDVGPRPSRQYSLDRDDSNGNYEPSNVHWVTRKQQARNRRNNRLIAVRGVVKCVAEWAEVLGLKYMALYRLIHKAKHRAEDVMQKLVDDRLAAEASSREHAVDVLLNEYHTSFPEGETPGRLVAPAFASL